MQVNQVSPDQVKNAYLKLKSYIYYDTTELFQRRKLAEFETGLIGSLNEFLVNILNKKELEGKLDGKFSEIANKINAYNSNNTFEDIFKKIDLIYLPKRFKTEEACENYSSNVRVEEAYPIESVTVFADLPIELLIVSILWLIEYGYKLDVILNQSCVGNRLILNNQKSGVIKGSGLFKPYFKQYQQWRDTAVQEAQRKLQEGNKIAFVNLDIKDYFYSVRINFEEIEAIIFPNGKYKGDSVIHDIFKEFHHRFTQKLVLKNYPSNLIHQIKEGQVVLPIGVPSSYVLANYYLNEFDNRITGLIPNVYYGRYVDDILLVIANPKFNFHYNKHCKDTDFNFEDYRKREGEDQISFAKSEEEYKKITKTEQFILETLYPLVILRDTPKELLDDNSKDQEKRIFEVKCLEGAFFQGKKTLLHYFDNEESTTVIDKLKQELEERTSEFRDFPENGVDDSSFDDQAYYLVFDGTEGKIRTLRDYKENRYGLSVFLANRIFSALRRSNKHDTSESKKVLKLFRGINALEHFRLWEKVFTYFIVNEDQKGFILFYKHVFEEIQKLNRKDLIQHSKISSQNVSKCLTTYFDISLELSLALNPTFIKKGSKEYKDLEIFHTIWEDELDFLNNIVLTKPNSFYLLRFRICNLIRHHYVAHPLINYTKASTRLAFNLVDQHLPRNNKVINKLEFYEDSIALSPRPVKFWECCIAISTQELLMNSKNHNSINGRYTFSVIFTRDKTKRREPDKIENDEFILEKAWELYYKINNVHFSTSQNTDNQFFRRISKVYEQTNENFELELNEIIINRENKFQDSIFISIANTDVKPQNIDASVLGKPNMSHERYKMFSRLLKESRRLKTDLFILPEFCVPYEFLSSLAKFSEKNQIAIVTGLEHWNVNNVCYNFIVTIIPTMVDGVKDSIVLYRLKNHYAPSEELLIRGYGYQIPKPVPYRYDLINWKNLYFTAMYCFEFADLFHRSLFKSKIDLLVVSEWNKDTSYFSNIVESISRDLHCYVAQVNTSTYGDSRLTQPTDSATKDILKLKGGINDAILLGEIKLNELRKFQLKYFEKSNSEKDQKFKPVPPDWNRDFVNKRIENKNILEDTED